MASDTPPSDSKWSKEQNKAFEYSLAVHYNDDNSRSKNARAVPGKTVEDLKLRHKDLQDDVVGIVSDKAPLPRCTSSGSSKNKNQNNKKSPRKRNIRKGLLWTENEHRLFLYGLEKCGRGDWKSISRYYVKSKTNSQVASHAQKFFNRLNSPKAGKRSSINDITVAYPFENPTDTKSEEASSDPSKQSTLPTPHVETKAGREEIVNPRPSETKLTIHGARVPSDDNLSSHDLDFVDQMIVDPDPSSPDQSPKRDITPPTMHYESPTNDKCVPESSSKQISDLGFASSHSVVACQPSTAQVLSYVPMAPASVAQVPGFTSHTVLDPSPSLAQVNFTSHKGSHHGPSTVQLPTFDIYSPKPANEPSKYLDFTDQMITVSGPLSTELRAFDIGVPFPSNQSIRKSNFPSQIITNPRNSTVELPTYKTCVPTLTNQPIQGLDFASQMISTTISSTAPSPALNARAPSFTDGPIHDLDLANICLPEMTSQPIQGTDFAAGMIIDPDFSISQLSTCDDFDLSFLNEPIEDADLTSPMGKDPHPSANMQSCGDFAPIPENQAAQGLECSTGMLSTINPFMGDYSESPDDSFDIASAFEMVSLDEFMLLDI